MKNEKAEKARAIYKYWNSLEEKGENALRKPYYYWGEAWEITDDKHIYADDVVLKAMDTNQLYGKMGAFGAEGKYHEIGINWGK